MANFFGLFDYTKEGPGVEKDAPHKKPLFEFLELYFKNFWKLLVCGFWFILLNLPVLTTGLALAGFTNVTRNLAIDSHSFGTTDFFETVKKNWKQALPAGIINLIIYAVLIFDVYFFAANGAGAFSIFGVAVCATVLIIFNMMQYYFWTLLITFKFNLKKVYINSFKFVFSGIKNNILISLVMLLFYGICYGLFYIGISLTIFIAILILLFVLPGFRFLLIEYAVFGNIKKYMILPYYREHPTEDAELRTRFGIDDEELVN